VAGLRELQATGKLGFRGGLAGLAAPAVFAAMLRGLFCSEWVVYAKRPFGGAEHALRYLGCYTHRVAISKGCRTKNSIVLRRRARCRSYFQGFTSNESKGALISARISPRARTASPTTGIPRSMASLCRE